MKTGIIVTTHCAGAGEDMKRKMTKTICKYLSNTPYMLCLASHTPIDEHTQAYCDGFIYDKDNSFQIDGLPQENLTHGMAELKSIHNAVNFLERFGCTHFLKVAYDNNPDADYTDIVHKAEQVCSQGYNMITAKWGNDISLGTHVFYSEIDFFKRNLSLSTPNVYQEQLEQSIWSEFNRRGILNAVYILDTYSNFLGHSFIQYSHAGGTRVDPYPFD